MSDNRGMGYTASATIARHVVNSASSCIDVITRGSGRLVVLIPSLRRGAEDFNDLGERLTLAKAKPGQLRYASAGVGTFQHLSSELFSLNRTPEEFAKVIVAEMGKWGKVVKQAGIRAE